MNSARKAGEKDLTLVLGTTLAAIKNKELDLGRSANDAEVVDILRKGVKTRKESVEQFTTAKRLDLAEKETAEIKMLEQFLPPAVDPAEVRAAVRAAIAAGATDIGKVMQAVMPQFKGRVDGKDLNGIVREELKAG
jgi:uncharacterized protein YqeY